MNKISTYGGYLRYSVQFRPGQDETPNDYPDVEIYVSKEYVHFNVTQVSDCCSAIYKVKSTLSLICHNVYMLKSF